jgi:hypothetical protein
MFYTIDVAKMELFSGDLDLEQLELNLESFKENSARNQAGRNCAI